MGPCPFIRLSVRTGVPSIYLGEGRTGGPVCRPYGMKWSRGVGSAKPGAVAEPQQRQFLQPQAPVGRIELINATQILRAENAATFFRKALP